MTSEQIEDLFLQLEHLHPSEEKEVLRDPDYEREQQEAEEAGRGVLWEDTQVVPFGQAPPPPPVPSPEEDWEELSEWDLRRLSKQLKGSG